MSGLHGFLPRPDFGTRIAVLTCAALLGLACSEDDGGSIDTAEFASFEASPARFAFPDVPIGETVTRTVRLFSRGQGQLVISNLRLRDQSSDGELVLRMEEPDGTLVDVPDRVVLEGASGGGAGDAGTADDPHITLVLEYTPSDDVEDSGSVTMVTNDSGNRSPSVPIEIGAPGAEIFVSPTLLDFGLVEAGMEKSLTANISNVGQGDLEITRLNVDGSQDFRAEIDGETVGGDLDAPLVIAPDETITLTVIYAPEILGPDQGELEIFSNDRDGRVETINLQANGADACIRVVPEVLDFGAALRVDEIEGESPNVRPVSIESCGTVPLRIDAIEIVGGDGLFQLVEAFEPFELPPPTEGAEPPTRQLQVAFFPLELQAYGAEMFITSNGTREPLKVDLFGRGVDNSCPVPISVSDEYNVQPLDIIDLDGTPSTDPGGEVTRWQWAVIDSPQGSVAQVVERFEDPSRPADGGPTDDDSTPTAKFFVDLAGRYVLELIVWDNLGQQSCAPTAVASVTIEAVPEKDLHVQLVWTTPDDPDQADTFGTDVDLHLRHQDANDRWNDAASGFDCYFANPEPDWGAPGDPSDNPSLDIDDTNGGGPENINLASPEVGRAYDIAALYFRSTSTFGDAMVDARKEHLSLVTVRVFARGDLLGEWLDREMTGTSQLWHVTRVRWCEDFARCPEIEPVDELLEPEDYIGD